MVGRRHDAAKACSQSLLCALVGADEGRVAMGTSDDIPARAGVAIGRALNSFHFDTQKLKFYINEHV